MWCDTVISLRRLFRYHIVHGEIIPPDARVDPDGFPEKEFPLFCPVCDYMLRGLPTERCPECGTPFDRGRLLVQQYVVEQGKKLWKQTGKYAKWLLIIGCLLIFIPQVLIALAASLTNTTLTTNITLDVLQFVVIIMTIGGMLLFISGFLYLHLTTVGRKKYTQVLGGIDRDDTSFKAAQHHKWVWWIVWLVLPVVLLLVSAVRSGSVWYRYYTQEPVRVLIPVIGALGLCIWFYIAIWVSKRRQDRYENQDKT